jgi:two-component system, cell cycle sensor histidine kinase and response regulator CckA
VLMNLCVNARDAMPAGGELEIRSCLQIRQPPAALLSQGAQGGLCVVMDVRDTGTGMPPAVLDLIFDPFFSTKAIGKGTGLGLSAVLGIVKSHGGWIDVQSQVGVGTTFQIVLPAYTDTVGSPSAGDDLLQGHQEMVLVVDDEAAIRETMKVMLESYNYRVLTAAGGMDAIALCRNHADTIHLMVIDLMMPRMDGFSTMSVLRQICPQIPAIAMSGVTPTETVHRAEAMGFQRFLAKPFSAHELLRVLQTITLVQ